jgi:DUF4097 and DUF4098 domain-containing protein YvlB
MSSPAPQIRYVRRRSLAGPIVLIALGVLFLLGNFHLLTWRTLGHYWARYWPVLIILWGVVKLVEHWQDNRDGVPGRGIGVGGVFLLIFIILLGAAATTADRVNWNALRGEIDTDSDFAGLFGNSYTFSNTVEQPFNAGDTLRVVDDNGEVTVSTWDEPKVKVVVSKKIVAENDADSRKFDTQTQPQFSTAGAIVTLNANTGGAGTQPVRSDLQIFLPAKAAVDVATRRGDVTVATRTGDVKVSTTRGDVTAKAITGNVGLDVRRGSVRVNDVTGDVTVDGRIDDTTISDVKGSVHLTGDYFGQMMLSHIAKGVSFQSSRTSMEMAAVPGELTLESGELRAKTITGPVSVATRSKEIHLENVSGDVKIENSNGPVDVRSGGRLGQMDITTTRADVQVAVPPQASFQLDARTRRGDIQTDFSVPVQNQNRDEQTATAVIGKGGPQVRIVTTNGTIEVRKSSAVSEAPPPPSPAVTPGESAPSHGPGAPPRAPRPPRVPSASTTSFRLHGPLAGSGVVEFVNDRPKRDML